MRKFAFTRLPKYSKSSRKNFSTEDLNNLSDFEKLISSILRFTTVHLENLNKSVHYQIKL